MFGVTENDLCGEHRFKSAMQWCLCVFLPRKTTCYILFNQTRRCDSTSFWLWGGTVSVLPTSICIGFTQRPCTKSAAQDFQAAPKCCCFFSSAAPMPGTSFSQYFLKALLMSSPLTFFITGALPFEFFAVLPHPLSSPHAFGTNEVQHLDCPFKVTPFEDGLCSLFFKPQPLSWCLPWPGTSAQRPLWPHLPPCSTLDFFNKCPPIFQKQVSSTVGPFFVAFYVVEFPYQRASNFGTDIANKLSIFRRCLVRLLLLPIWGVLMPKRYATSSSKLMEAFVWRISSSGFGSNGWHCLRLGSCPCTVWVEAALVLVHHLWLLEATSFEHTMRLDGSGFDWPGRLGCNGKPGHSKSCHVAAW